MKENFNLTSNFNSLDNYVNPISPFTYISGDKVIEMFKKGHKIHIKKKNRGSFTRSAKKAGMGVQEYARHVLANKDKYSSTLVKRANFARNSAKWSK